MDQQQQRDPQEEAANRSLLTVDESADEADRLAGDDAASQTYAEDLRTLDEVHQDRPALLVRVAQLDRTPCPGPPLHDCKDRTHPVAVQVLRLEVGGPAHAFPIVNGADSIAVQLFADGEPAPR